MIHVQNRGVISFIISNFSHIYTDDEDAFGAAAEMTSPEPANHWLRAAANQAELSDSSTVPFSRESEAGNAALFWLI